MGNGPSMEIQAAMSAHRGSSGGIPSEDMEAHDVRRLRWILRVANNPGSCEEWYMGDERDGVRHGVGAAFYTSGDVYNGQWYKGAWHGRGTLTYMSGEKYSGHFEMGEQHGSGELDNVDGVRFRGEFRKGRKHGPGLMASPNGAQFEGWFREDLAHGDGILTWPDGGKFVGKYLAGKEHGRGAIFDPLGCKICDIECAAGTLIGGRTVCPGSLGEGKGPKCKGGSQSCGFCLQTALDLELSIELDEPDALEGLSVSGSGVGRRSRTSSGILGNGGSGGSGSLGSYVSGVRGMSAGGKGYATREDRRVVRVKPRPYSRADDVRAADARVRRAGGGSGGGIGSGGR